MLKRFTAWMDRNQEFLNGVMLGMMLVICGIGLSFIAFWMFGEESPDVVWEDTVRLEDTRTVHCIGFASGGVSCDWTHVSGGDNL